MCSPPNVIVIQADDQNRSDLTPKVMPQTTRFLSHHGTRFSHYIVSTPQCCPSRASLLTGQYPHNDGVFSNGPGYPTLLDKASTLPAWLEGAGYITVHVGKYLNGYVGFAGALATPAPGWDRWFTVSGESSRYYDYPLGVDGHLVDYGIGPRSYVTRVLQRRAIRMIAAYAGGKRPLYLQLDERAPHIATGGWHPSDICGHAERAIPDPRDVGRFANATLPMPPAFNEPHVSDKPPFIPTLPPLSRTEVGNIARRYRCRLSALVGVDRTIGRIRQALHAAHALGDTIVIYISDNGVLDGQHRIPSGKIVPYEKDLRQPLLIRVPHAYLGARRHAQVTSEVANVDIAPTILDFAGAQPCAVGAGCRTMDGRSLVPLLQGKPPPWTRGRAILTEYQRAGAKNAVCAYRGLELRQTSYVHYTSVSTSRRGSCDPVDENELYNLSLDPWELRNLSPAALGSPAYRKQARLEHQLADLADCSGIEGRDPLPASGHYCD
jgi:N-acetylglucosamine-6-sulfatase